MAWGDEVQEAENGCRKNLFPFDGTNDMSFEVNEDNRTLTLNGMGAYINWPDMANGIDEIPQPYLPLSREFITTRYLVKTKSSYIFRGIFGTTDSHWKE